MNTSNPSIEEIDAQLAATTGSFEDILDEEADRGIDANPSTTNNNGDAADDDGDDDAMPPLPGLAGAAVPEVLAEARAFTLQDEQRELNSLTLQERLALQSDLLGITAGVSGLAVSSQQQGEGGCNDADGGRAATLRRLEEELAALPGRQTKAYRRAQRVCPDDVSDRRKMAFVEYDNGSVREAAARLALYWEERAAAFGPDRAFLPMTLAGAMKDEVVPMINYPIWQVLPRTDSAGRPILYGQTNRRDFAKYSPQQEMRALMYMLETICEDDDLRRSGYVTLYNAQNVQQDQASRALTKQFVKLLENVYPIRCRASHMCHPTKFMFYMFLPVVKMFMPKELRLRLQIHYGDNETVLRELDGFCLSRDRVPNALGGDLQHSINQCVLDRVSLENRRLLSQIHSAELTGNGNGTNSSQGSVTSDLTGSSMPLDGDGYETGPTPKRHRGASSKARPKTVSSSFGSKDKKSRRKKRKAGVSSKELDPYRGPPRGKYVDPRMQKAVEAKMDDPKLSLYDALVAGGFVFRDDPSVKDGMIDMDGTTLAQRKNNLCRRIRLEKEKLVKKSGS